MLVVVGIEGFEDRLPVVGILRIVDERQPVALGDLHFRPVLQRDLLRFPVRDGKGRVERRAFALDRAEIRQELFFLPVEDELPVREQLHDFEIEIPVFRMVEEELLKILLPERQHFRIRIRQRFPEAREEMLDVRLVLLVLDDPRVEVIFL